MRNWNCFRSRTVQAVELVSSLPCPIEHSVSLSQTSRILVGPAISKDNRYQRVV